MFSKKVIPKSELVEEQYQTSTDLYVFFDGKSLREGTLK